MLGRIAEFEQFLQVEENASGHTVRNYISDLRQLRAFLLEHHQALNEEGTEVAAERVDQIAMRAFLAALLRRNRRSSVGRKLSAAKGFFRFLLRRNLIARDPTAGVLTPKKQQQLPVHLTVDDMFRLLEAPSAETPDGLRDRALLEVLYSCGLRVSELVGLDWSDVDASLELVRVRGKGGKERLVPIGRKALAALAAYRGRLPELCPRRLRDQKAVYLNRRGGRLTARSVARLVERYVLTSGKNSCLGSDIHGFVTSLNFARTTARARSASRVACWCISSWAAYRAACA